MKKTWAFKVEPSHLITVASYNRLRQLNATVESIRRHKIKCDVVIVSKGNVMEKDLRCRVKDFIKAENIGYESHAYIYSFLKYPGYDIYTFIQDVPKSVYGMYYGDKINRGIELIQAGEYDFTTGMVILACNNCGWPHHYDSLADLFSKIAGERPDVGCVGKYFNFRKGTWFFAPNQCFSIKGDLLRKYKKCFEEVLEVIPQRKMFAWEMERVWMSLAEKPAVIDQALCVISAPAGGVRYFWLRLRKRIEMAWLGICRELFPDRIHA